jgi:mercuric ion binding protein
MKTLHIILITILVSFSINKSFSQKNMDFISAKVDGLGCAYCAYGLDKKFKEIKGIKKIKIDLEKGILEFEYPTKFNINFDLINQQIQDAGYTTKQISIDRFKGELENKDYNTKDLKIKQTLKENEIYVYGNCNMCKSRIEKVALKFDGVTSATWNVDSKILEFTTNKSINKSKLEQVIAKSGHETHTIKKDSEAYKNLPECCKY